MPIEREVKFLMQPSTTAEWLALRPSLRREESMAIEQIYVGSARMRQIMGFNEDGTYATDKPSRYRFTWKHPVKGGKLEIETDITGAEYHDAAAVAERRLWKERNVFLHEPTGLKVEFDTFVDLCGESIETWLQMIEIEYEPGQEALIEEVAKTFASRVRMRVTATDNRFDNYRLADPVHARALLTELGGDPNSISMVA